MNHPCLIHHFLEESARRFPDKVALIHKDVRAPYDRINSAANQLASYLRDQELNSGDRVVLALENCLEYVVSYYGVLKAGGVIVPISSDIKPDGLAPLLHELDPACIISSSKVEKTLQAIDLDSSNLLSLILRDPGQKWDSCNFPMIAWEDIIGNGTTPNPDLAIDPSSLATIIYTSGSTGRPKGVMLSHRNIVSNTDSICSYLQLSHADIQMVVLPFYYVMGKSLLNTHFAVGGTVVLNNTFAFPATVIKEMEAEKVTGFSGVPSSYAHLLHHSPLADYREKLTSLRYCTQAGGHMSRAIKEKLRRALPDHTRIFIMYGATEASARLTYLEPERYLDKMDSIGKPIPGVTLRVLDSHGNDVETGQTGQLVASGPNIMMGYWQDKASTAAVLDENGYHTGDLGFQDDESYLYLAGRKDDLLKVSGHRINPREIEDAIMGSDLAVETAVIGVPDDLMGHRLIALVAPIQKDCTENQILRHCAEKLPKYKIPSEIKLVRAIPKSQIGKIDRTRCLEIIQYGE